MVTLSGIVTLVRDMQPSKAYSPIETTPLLMFKVSNARQAEKVCLLIDVRLPGIVRVVNDLQSSKAYSPIEVTPSGILMLVKDSHLSKA